MRKQGSREQGAGGEITNAQCLLTLNSSQIRDESRIIKELMNFRQIVTPVITWA